MLKLLAAVSTRHLRALGKVQLLHDDIYVFTHLALGLQANMKFNIEKLLACLEVVDCGLNLASASSLPPHRPFVIYMSGTSRSFKFSLIAFALVLLFP